MNELIQARARTGTAGEAEFLRRRNSRLINKQKRIRAIRIKGLHMFLIFSVLIAAAMLAYKISFFMLTWEKLNIKTFVLIDKPTFKTGELEEILRHFNGNILTLRFSDLRKSLLTFNEVKDVSITRQLPSTVEVRFILRKPVFQVAINGKYNIMDTEGVILYTSKTDSNDLISIRGIARGELGELVPYLPELSRLKASIQYVTLKKPYGIVLKMKGKKELFYPGETHFARKINNYLKLRQQPQLSKYNITCVDLRFKDRFYFEYETEVKN
jgi:cell division septal protein FtsQ